MSSIPVGIDIGNHKCVISVFKDGAVKTLLNEESKHETPTVVHFSDKHRLFGTAAANYARSFPKSTISDVKRLVGRRSDEQQIDEELGRLPYETFKDTNGRISIRVPYGGETYEFSALEMLVMLLSHLKRTAEKSLGSTISDCVIGIPSSFTQLQRREYLQAAEIVGLNPLQLLHDGTATALGYGYYRSSKHQAASHVMIVDIGHCHTQVTVVRFDVEGMKVLAHAFDGDLGGRDFDEIIYEDVVNGFTEEVGIDVRSDAKASVRLRRACEAAKKVLSVNREALVSVDALAGGRDVQRVMTQKTFEKLSLSLLRRIKDVCDEALGDAGLRVEMMQFLEVVGSGSRVPAISKFLEQGFGKRLSRTLNGSECVAFGCALKCAAMLGSAADNCVKPYEVGLTDESGKYKLVIEIALDVNGIVCIVSTSLNKRDENSFFSNGLPSTKSKHMANIMKDGTLTQKIEFFITESIIGGATYNDNEKAKDQEFQLAEGDRFIERSKDTRNELESCINSIRLKYIRVTDEAEKQTISTRLTEIEGWLQNSQEDEYEQASKYLNDLQSVISRIKNSHEENIRVQATPEIEANEGPGLLNKTTEDSASHIGTNAEKVVDSHECREKELEPRLQPAAPEGGEINPHDTNTKDAFHKATTSQIVPPRGSQTDVFQEQNVQSEIEHQMSDHPEHDASLLTTGKVPKKTSNNIIASIRDRLGGKKKKSKPGTGEGDHIQKSPEEMIQTNRLASPMTSEAKIYGPSTPERQHRQGTSQMPPGYPYNAYGPGQHDFYGSQNHGFPSRTIKIDCQKNSTLGPGVLNKTTQDSASHIVTITNVEKVAESHNHREKEIKSKLQPSPRGSEINAHDAYTNDASYKATTSQTAPPRGSQNEVMQEKNGQREIEHQTLDRYPERYAPPMTGQVPKKTKGKSSINILAPIKGLLGLGAKGEKNNSKPRTSEGDQIESPEEMTQTNSSNDRGSSTTHGSDTGRGTMRKYPSGSHEQEIESQQNAEIGRTPLHSPIRPQPIQRMSASPSDAERVSYDRQHPPSYSYNAHETGPPDYYGSQNHGHPFPSYSNHAPRSPKVTHPHYGRQNNQNHAQEVPMMTTNHQSSPSTSTRPQKR